MDMDSILEELSALFRKSDYAGAREMIKSLVVIGLCDSELAESLLKA